MSSHITPGATSLSTCKKPAWQVVQVLGNLLTQCGTRYNICGVGYNDLVYRGVSITVVVLVLSPLMVVVVVVIYS